MSIPSIPELIWTEQHRGIIWQAPLPDDYAYRIISTAFGYDLWLDGPADDNTDGYWKEYLGKHANLDAAKAAAKTHVGDDSG